MKLSVSKGTEFLEQIDLESVVATAEGEVRLVIGRSPSCHIHLDDMQISREHALISFENDEWSIISESNFIPVMLNGENVVGKKTLSNSDVINIGLFQLFVTLPDSIFAGSNIESELDQMIEQAAPVEETNTDETQTVAMSSEEEISEEEGEVESEEGTGAFENDESYSQEEGLLEDEEQSEYQEEVDEDQLEIGEDEYYDEEYSDEYEDDGAMEEYDEDKTQVFSTNFAEFFLDLLGPSTPFDKVTLTDMVTTIGRDPAKAKIVLNDSEVSGLHAEIIKRNAQCYLVDKDSGNGTLLNGKRIKEEQLQDGDEFIIGSTTFTFRASSVLSQQEFGRLMPVEENQIMEIEEEVIVDEEDIDEDDFDFGEAGDANKSNSLFSKDALKDPEKRKKILIFAVVIIGAWTMLGDDSSKKKVVPKKKVEKSNRLVKKKDTGAVKKKAGRQRDYTPEELEFFEQIYTLARDLYEQGKFAESAAELEKIFADADDYKNARQLYNLANEGLASLEEAEKKRIAAEEKKARKKKVKSLVETAREAVKDRKEEVARALFSKITQLDPENFDVAQLKIELDSWKKKEQEKAVKEAQKKADRARKIKDITPSRELYSQKKWYLTIKKIQLFLKIPEMDEDLTKEALDMLEKSKSELANIIDPLIGKARSLVEGQDLKGAYELYVEILNNDPDNLEASKEISQIRDTLINRSRKIYREALIYENLYLFEEAKEKFQEVQQISPTDSEYFKRASKKLKNYLD